MRRVLIVSPNFPPVSTADMHRARLALPHLATFGWSAHVLAVEPADTEGRTEPALINTIPSDVPITRVRALPLSICSRAGIRSLGIRAYPSLRKAGNRLLSEQKFDAVYFTTTIFRTMNLGSYWKKRYGVPFGLDIQDMWVSDYYRRTGIRPPGGKLKYGITQYLARKGEREAVREAAFVTSVSPAYPAELLTRYSGLDAGKFHVLGFGASRKDFDAAGAGTEPHGIFDPRDGRRHWVYLGRGGDDMARGLRGLFKALARARQVEPEAESVRLHFVGTSYAQGAMARETIMPIARECGVGDLVTEQTSRLPYLRGLSLLRDADTIMVVGSDDPGYSASKVYPCVAAERPILAIMREESSAARVVTDCRAGEVVTFGASDDDDALSGKILPVLIGHLRIPRGTTAPIDWTRFEPYSSREMTRRLCEIFERPAGVGR